MGSDINQVFPTFMVDFHLEDHLCKDLEDSRAYTEELLGLAGSRRKYIQAEHPADDQLVVACINLCNITYQEYWDKVKKTHKGNALRNAKKADQLGFICKPFVRSLFIPDIAEINHSKEIRSCGPMTEGYRKTVKELGGAPVRYTEFKLPECPTHYGFLWGIFKPEHGYKQGEVTTNEKLLGYIRFRRIGNFGTYSMILGHGEYLQHGIMYRLHLAVMEWLCQENNIYSKGLDILGYSGYYDGDEGLNYWKRKTCFEPAYLVTNNA